MRTIKLTNEQAAKLMDLAAGKGLVVLNYNGQLALKFRGELRAMVVYTSYERPGRRYSWFDASWRPVAVEMKSILAA